jgi:hypothetical protein
VNWTSAEWNRLKEIGADPAIKAKLIQLFKHRRLRVLQSESLRLQRLARAVLDAAQDELRRSQLTDAVGGELAKRAAQLVDTNSRFLVRSERKHRPTQSQFYVVGGARKRRLLSHDNWILLIDERAAAEPDAYASEVAAARVGDDRPGIQFDRGERAAKAFISRAAHTDDSAAERLLSLDTGRVWIGLLTGVLSPDTIVLLEALLGQGLYHLRDSRPWTIGSRSLSEDPERPMLLRALNHEWGIALELAWAGGPPKRELIDSVRRDALISIFRGVPGATELFTPAPPLMQSSRVRLGGSRSRTS